MSDVWPLPVDLRRLEAFAAVAAELHFTRAAQRLRVSQPALSQQIIRLERQLGVQLFVRGPGTVSLTPSGEALWHEVEPAMAALRAGIDAARAAANGTRELRVEHLSSYGPMVMPQVAARLREIDTELTIRLHEAGIEEQVDALHDRRADVGVFHLDPDVVFEVPGIETTVVAQAPRFVALPVGHRLAGATEVSLADLADDVWVMPSGTAVGGVQEANVIAACRRHGFAPRIGQHANSIETMLGLVASGFGIAPAPWPVALRPPSSLHLARATDLAHRVVVARTWRREQAPGVTAFLGATEDVVGRLLAVV